MTKNKLTLGQFALKENWQVLQLLALIPSLAGLQSDDYLILLCSVSVIALTVTVVMVHRLKIPDISIEAAKHAAALIVAVHFYALAKTSGDGLNWPFLTATLLVLLAFARLLYKDFKEFTTHEQ
ncbi:hypothetical protein QWY20_16275 [Alkalimonas sp. MEB108]|uniref:Uncharacterized protein n=1 Tax=Alkalimonas cellulosilytica TaxID=3058395 RepID=A0ABU7J8Z2_9GAMM|nr:hypothetical protein [Alkalimonas sp. MEB108]MEE2003016.1 hypothetical protein [Alkalimonas sp. MEB108]